MLGNKFINTSFKALLLLSLAGCAKQSAPAGGPKDIIPPVVLKTVPVSGVKNFKGNRIVITFNEYVTLDKISDKFMTSPPMKKMPKIFIRGKNVIAEFNEELHENTTYTFNFQDAIKDLNEGNAIPNYQFVFSTGPVIDSLSVTGTVYMADNLNPPDDALVLLYDNLTDSAVKKLLPSYISHTDKNGYFRINNLQGGRYRLYALKDVDNSKNFNLPDEQFAFLDSTITVSPEKNYFPKIQDTSAIGLQSVKMADSAMMAGEYKLYMFEPEKKVHYLSSSSRNAPYKMTYTLSLPPDSIGFDFSIPGTGKDSYFTESNASKDTVVVWLTDSALYSRPIITSVLTYPFTDSTGAEIAKQDTIPMRFLKPVAARAKSTKAPYKVSSGLSKLLKPGRKIIITSATPMLFPDTSKIRIYEIAGAVKARVPYSFIKDSSTSCRYILKTNLAPGKEYLYIADSAAYGDIYGEKTDSTGIRFVLRSESTFGSIDLTIKNYTGQLIIQLLNPSEKLLEQKIIDDARFLEFKYLDQGKYRLRAIYDLNRDGKWTTGDFDSKRQPEPVSYYWQEISVPEGWKVSQDWDLGIQNFRQLKQPAGKTKGK